jgi:hypothetical protein
MIPVCGESGSCNRSARSELRLWSFSKEGELGRLTSGLGKVGVAHGQVRELGRAAEEE